MKIVFTVPGTPVAKARPRMMVLKQCIHCKGKLTAKHACPQCGGYDLKVVREGQYTPETTMYYENMVRMCAKQALGETRFTGPIKFTASAFLTVPKSRARKLKEGEPHTQKPDADNILKSLVDGCDLAWADDCLVYSKTIQKFWTHGQPYSQIEIETEEPGEIKGKGDSL